MTMEEMKEMMELLNASKPQVTQTMNYYGSIGQQIAHVDKIEAHFDKDMGMQVTMAEDVGKPQAEVKEDTNKDIVEELKGIFFGNADVARKFLTEITGVKSTQVIEIVGLYLEKKEISELSCHRDLWNILHNNGYYEPTESNWNKAINKL